VRHTIGRVAGIAPFSLKRSVYASLGGNINITGTFVRFFNILSTLLDSFTSHKASLNTPSLARLSAANVSCRRPLLLLRSRRLQGTSPLCIPRIHKQYVRVYAGQLRGMPTPLSHAHLSAATATALRRTPTLRAGSFDRRENVPSIMSNRNRQSSNVHVTTT
jgi:hypothetical protein